MSGAKKGQSLQALQSVSSRTSDERVRLEWSDIKYSMYVKDARKSKFMAPAYIEKHILKGISGSAISGQLLAIMGPTGCGKTSLLNVLASRTQSAGSNFSSLAGEVKLNGKIRDEDGFRRISAYVMQDDLLYPHMTVTETLQLAAQFFLPLKLSPEQKAAVVNEIITELSLTKAKDTIIGNEKVRGISGGERKRAAIAAQLITDPAVLFLDEPTSGLDSFQALSVMECMKTMADHGRIVISVIHQPRSSIFSMFDQLLLLSEGHAIFMGEATKASEYFASVGYSNPNLFNPADFFLDVLSPDNRTEEKDKESRNRIEELATQWKTAAAIKRNNDKDCLQNYSNEIRPIGNETSFTKTLINFKLLCWRSFTESRRDVATLRVKLFSAILFSLIFGGIYSSTGNGQSAVQNRPGFLFIVCLNQAFGGLIAVLNAFPREKIIMNRERVGRAYDTTSYFLAKFFTEIPANILPPFVFCCISYWIVGLQPTAGHFFTFVFFICFEALVAISLGLVISAAAPNVEAATAAGPPILILCVLFGGYYINISTIPIVANWLPYLSLVKWAFQAIAINELKDATFICDAPHCFTTGQQVLDSYNFDAPVTMGNAALGLSVLFIIFLLLAYTLLVVKKITYISIGHQGVRYSIIKSIN